METEQDAKHKIQNQWHEEIRFNKIMIEKRNKRYNNLWVKEIETSQISWAGTTSGDNQLL